MDFNTIIRSAVLSLSESTDDWNFSIGAGGAITALSDAGDEYEEMNVKARAVMAAVQEWASLSSDLKLHIKNTNLTASTRA
jgi:anthranilate/para-aminobenzoate synthase component I